MWNVFLHVTQCMNQRQSTHLYDVYMTTLTVQFVSFFLLSCMPCAVVMIVSSSPCVLYEFQLDYAKLVEERVAERCERTM